MAPPTLPEAPALPRQSTETKKDVLDTLFEPHPAIHDLLIPVLDSTSFSSYDELIDCFYSRMQTLLSNHYTDRESIHAILSSHPRLGANRVGSARSSAEQAQLRTGDGAELAKLNGEYEARFPGLRYVVFVNGRGLPEIIVDMRQRIERADFALEEQEGIRAMRDIAKDRVRKIQNTG